MNIRLRPAVPSDAPSLAEVNIKAFAGHGFMENTFSGVSHDVIYELKRSRYLKKIAHPQTQVIVAEDNDSGAVVGCARWVFPAGDVEGAGDEDSAEEALPEGTNRGIYTGFFEILKEKGKPYHRDDDVVLEFIATLPQHQRQGVGKALLRWGIERAEAEHRRIYLEATTEGFPVYEKSGWRALDRVEIDYTQWGGTGVQVLTLMLRDPAACQA